MENKGKNSFIKDIKVSPSTVKLSKFYDEIYECIKGIIDGRKIGLSSSDDEIIKAITEKYKKNADELGIASFDGYIGFILSKIKRDKVNEIIDLTIKFYKEMKKQKKLDDKEIYKACVNKAQKYQLASLVTRNLITQRLETLEK